MTIALLAFVMGTVPVNGSAQAATTQQTQTFNKKELKTLIANARTPEDHERIAAYYRAEGEQLKAKQREHEEELAEYLKNPSSHPVPKWPTMDQHCRGLISYYSKAAQKAFELADLHDQMAKRGKQNWEKTSSGEIASCLTGVRQESQRRLAQYFCAPR